MKQTRSDRQNLKHYLQNGPDYIPFSTFDLKIRKKNHPSSPQPQPNNEFMPFQNERDCFGKIIRPKQIQENVTKQNTHTNEYIFSESPSPKAFLNKQQQSQPLPQLVLDYASENERTDDKNKPCGKNQITKYVTELSIHRSPIQSPKICDEHYKKKPNLLENFAIQKTPQKSVSHHAFLVGKHHHKLELPGVGDYEPSYSQLNRSMRAHKWIKSVKSSKIELMESPKSARVMFEDDSVNRQQETNSQEPVFEVLYARTIRQIKREVAYDVKRNPSIRSYHNGPYLKTVMTQEEALEQKDMMMNKLKQIKESINKVRNFMNMRRY